MISSHMQILMPISNINWPNYIFFLFNKNIVVPFIVVIGLDTFHQDQVLSFMRERATMFYKQPSKLRHSAEYQRVQFLNRNQTWISLEELWEPCNIMTQSLELRNKLWQKIMQRGSGQFQLNMKTI